MTTEPGKDYAEVLLKRANETGKILKDTHDLRQKADYSAGIDFELTDVVKMIEEAPKPPLILRIKGIGVTLLMLPSLRFIHAVPY